MSEHKDAVPGNIRGQAEFEIAAFLKATIDVVGQSVLCRAVDAWLHVMDTLDWPEEDYEKFFRKVTRLAIRQLYTNVEKGANAVPFFESEDACFIPDADRFTGTEVFVNGGALQA